MLKIMLLLTFRPQIAVHCLITHLLSSPISQAAVIDTTGTFDLLRLHDMIVARIKSKMLTENARKIGDLQPEMSPPPRPTEDAEKTAEKALERVKILRVFDFVGVVEAVGELSEELREDHPAGKDKNQETQSRTRPSPQRKPRTEIADSDEEEDDSEEDMLFVSPKPTTKPSSPPSDPLEKIGMIIIDNITQPLTPILKANYARTQSLLTTFLTSLRHLTETYNLATLLLNTASAPKSSSFAYLKTNNNNNHNANHNHNHNVNAIPQSTYVPDPLFSTPTFADQVSIFASTSVRPALGKTFAYQLDLHVLVSSLPKRRRDAEVVVGRKSGRAEVVGVIEVLADRGDERAGMWAAFCIGKDGGLMGAF